MNGMKPWLLFLTLAGLQTQVLADECDAILEQGVMNTYQELKNINLKSGLKKTLCSESTISSSDSSGGGLGIGIPIEGVPVKFNGDFKQAQNNASSAGSCSSDSANLSEDTYRSTLTKIVAPEIVNAWSLCRSNKGGFIIKGDLSGNLLLLEFSFKPVGKVTSAVLTTDPDITGADCPSPIFKTGSVITNTTQLQKCYRLGSGEVSVIANSDFDAAKFFVPAVTPPPKLPSIDPIGKVLPAPKAARPLENLDGSPGSMAPPLGMSWCIINSSELPSGTPRSACITSESTGACTCPRFGGSPPVPIGTYSGKVYE